MVVYGLNMLVLGVLDYYWDPRIPIPGVILGIQYTKNSIIRILEKRFSYQDFARKITIIENNSEPEICNTMIFFFGRHYPDN